MKPEPVPVGTSTSFIVYGLVRAESWVICTTEGVARSNRSPIVFSCCCSAPTGVSRSTTRASEATGSPVSSAQLRAAASTEWLSGCETSGGCLMRTSRMSRAGRRAAGSSMAIVATGWRLGDEPTRRVLGLKAAEIFRAVGKAFKLPPFYDRSQYTEYVSSITSESGHSTAEGMGSDLAARPAGAAAGGGCRNQDAGGYTAAPVASSKLACAAKALKAADSLCTLSAGLRCSVTAFSRVPAWG